MLHFEFGQDQLPPPHFAEAVRVGSAFGRKRVLLHHRRPVWQGLGHHELRHCLHGQGHGRSLRAPVRPACLKKTGFWTKVFWAMIASDLVAAFLALFWLKVAAARTVKASESAAPVDNLTEPMKA